MNAEFSKMVPAWYRPKWRPVSKTMLNTAALISGLSMDEIKSKNRDAYICRIRFAAMYALRSRGLSLPRIGAMLGGRNHTTILSGLKRANEIRAVDPSFVDLCEALRA